jgi:hypothetical protein
MNELEKRAKYHAKHQDGMSPFYSLGESKSLKEAPDIFGIETDAEIAAEMDKRREAAWAKRREIIDGDMLGYVSNYEMLDKMATKKTLKDKKDFIVNYIMGDLPEVRKGPDFRGKQSFIYNSKYKDKPVDRAMAEKCADFILDKFKNEDGVRFYKDPNGIVRDANGINVNETRYNNNNIKFKYREEIMHKKFPNIKYFHELSKEQQEAIDMEAKELWLADDNYVEIVPLSESKNKKKPYSSINKNAGNVEYNNKMFNAMNNSIESPINNPVNGPFGENISGEGIGESIIDDHANQKSADLLTRLNSLESCKGVSKVPYELAIQYKSILNEFPVGTVLKLKIDAGEETYTKTDSEFWKHYRAPWGNTKVIHVLDLARWFAGRKYISRSSIEYSQKKLDEAASKKETIELEYKDLEFTQYGPKRDVDDWDEWDRCIDWTYKVDKNDLYTFIFESCIDETDFPEAFEDEFDPNNTEHWARFENWLDDNFDFIYNKYEQKILEHWKEAAIEEARNEYDPDDEYYNESLKNNKDKELVYDNTAATPDLFEVATPQECADLFGKPVRDGDKVYYPKTNEDIQADLMKASSDIKQMAAELKNKVSNNQLNLKEELSKDVRDFIIGEAEYGELDINDIIDSLIYMNKKFDESEVRKFVDEVNNGNVTKDIPSVIINGQASYRYGETDINNIKTEYCLTVNELIEYLNTTFDGDEPIVIKYNNEYCPLIGSNFIDAKITKKIVD